MGASLGELSASSEFGDPRSGHIVYIMSIYMYIYLYIHILCFCCCCCHYFGVHAMGRFDIMFIVHDSHLCICQSMLLFILFI